MYSLSRKNQRNCLVFNYTFLQTEKKKWTEKLIDTENKWLEKMDNYKKMMDSEHREEVEALTKEWTNEQKVKYIIFIYLCYLKFIFY